MHIWKRRCILYIRIAVDVLGLHLRGPDASGSFFIYWGVLRSNEKLCVCNVFAILHSKNPVKSSAPSSLNIKFSWELTCKPLEKIHFVLYKIWCHSIDCIEVNKISGYILATKTLQTKRIMRITNHKTHVKRINNTLYKRLYECKRRVWIKKLSSEIQCLCGFEALLKVFW